MGNLCVRIVILIKMKNKYLEISSFDNPRVVCISPVNDAIDVFSDANIGNKYIVKIIELTAEEWDNLPGFEGF